LNINQHGAARFVDLGDLMLSAREALLGSQALTLWTEPLAVVSDNLDRLSRFQQSTRNGV
jgi:hypothetical protein